MKKIEIPESIFMFLFIVIISVLTQFLVGLNNPSLFFLALADIILSLILFFFHGFKKFLKETHPLNIIVNYIFVMFILAALFPFLFVLGTDNNNYFSSCNDNSIHILPELYISLTNLFSLSYTEPICVHGLIMRFLMGFEAIFGHIFSLIVLGFVMGKFLNPKNLTQEIIAS